MRLGGSQFHNTDASKICSESQLVAKNTRKKLNGAQSKLHSVRFAAPRRWERAKDLFLLERRRAKRCQRGAKSDSGDSSGEAMASSASVRDASNEQERKQEGSHNRNRRNERDRGEGQTRALPRWVFVRYVCTVWRDK